MHFIWVIFVEQLLFCASNNTSPVNTTVWGSLTALKRSTPRAGSGARAPPCAASRCHAAALGAAKEARPRRGARGEVGARERAAGADDDGAGRPRAGEAVAERAELEPSSSAAGGDGSAAS